MLLAGLAGALLLRGREEPELRLGRRVPLTRDPGLEIEPALSPDGRLVAYAAGLMPSLEIRVRQVDGGAAIAVAGGSERPQRWPSWSPDGSHIMFGSPRGIEIVSALGGTARVVVPHVPDPNADPWGSAGLLMPGGWTPDGKSIAFIRADTLYLQALDGDKPRALAHGGEMHSLAWSPDGRWIACVLGNRQAQQPGFLFANGGGAALGRDPGDRRGAAGVDQGPVLQREPGMGTRQPLADLHLQPRRRSGSLPDAAAGNGRPAGEPSRLTNGLHALSVSVVARRAALRLLGFHRDIQRVLAADPEGRTGVGARRRADHPR